MSKLPKPPKAYDEFLERYPKLGKAWDLLHAAGEEGPLDTKTIRLVKLGIAMGAQKEGAVRAGVRKARAQGISQKAIDQVVALAAGTIGMPSTVAAFTWVRDSSKKKRK